MIKRKHISCLALILPLGVATLPTPTLADDPVQMQSMTVLSPADEENIYKMRQARDGTPDDSSAAPQQPQKNATSADHDMTVRTLTITPDPAPQTPQTTVQKKPAVPAEKEKAVDTADEKPATLTPTKKLKPWGKMDELFVARPNDRNTKKALDAFENEPGRVSPSGLLQISQLYLNQGDMAKAARYYYAAQLRARFDAARWPLRGPQNAVRRIAPLVEEIGEQIEPWVTESSTRLSDVLNDTRLWDAQTPYDYHPGFPLPDADNNKIPKEDEWPDVLQSTRTAFFRDAGAIAGALKAMGK